MHKKLLSLGAFLLFVSGLSAQELNCKVKINTEQIEGTNKQVFASLEGALSEFVNTRKWSETQFSTVEKIDCSLQFTIKSIPMQDRYSAELVVQSRRPVFNAAYTTSVFNFKDDEVEFNYVENQPIEYNEQSIESNLVGIVSYYVYMILGVDFDSFSPNGGLSFYRMAENIVTLSQTSNEKGWKAFDGDRNRHALVSSFLQESQTPFRELWYEYHRKGLDDMAQNPEKGRSRITQSLDALKKVHEVNPRSVLLSLFIDTKIDELINIYSKASSSEKENIYKLLMDLYPSYSSRLAEIKKESK